MATRGRRNTGTSPTPMAASNAISREPSLVPSRSTVSPAAMSDPAPEIAVPAATACRISTIPDSGHSVHSTITTASAPRGIIAPVAIVVAAPADTSQAGAMPGVSDSAFRRRRRGASGRAPSVSAARTAKPSMFERSKPGTSTCEGKSRARIRPRALASGTVSSPSGSSFRCRRKRASASSRLTTSRNCFCRLPARG